jgi:hypothetical protein
MRFKAAHLYDCNPGALAVFLIGIAAVSLLAVSGF